MINWYRIVRPLLFLLDPEDAHTMAIKWIKMFSNKHKELLPTKEQQTAAAEMRQTVIMLLLYSDYDTILEFALKHPNCIIDNDAAGPIFISGIVWARKLVYKPRKTT